MALDIQGTDFLKLPVGTTGQRPVTPASGMTRQNSTTGAPEWYDSTSASWVQFSQQTATSPNTFGFKNRIINGGMVIDQRNAGASVTPTNGQYLVDRFVYLSSQASKFTAQQNAGSVTPPVGFINYLGFTSTSAYSLTSGDYFTTSQPVEGLNVADLGWGTASAATVTLSFRVYSSLTGTFGGSITNNGSTRSYPFSYSIPVANTWTTISITIAGDTSGTWLKTNGNGMTFNFSLGTGTTYSGTAGSWAGANYLSATGATSVVGTSGATFYITGVQLEVGSTATSFDFRSYGTELALCQRYCFALVFNRTVGANLGTTSTLAYTALPVTMRTAPSVTYTSAGSYSLVNSGGDGLTVTSISALSVSQDSISSKPFVASGLTSGGATVLNQGSGLTVISAEL